MDGSPAQQITRRLIDSRRSGDADDASNARATAEACNHLYRELSRWVGPDGCRALFTRALAEARVEFPSLKDFQLRDRSELHGDGAEITIAHADDATAEALESMLVHLVNLLGRLIGTDMAMNLIERGLGVPGGTKATSAGKREGM